MKKRFTSLLLTLALLAGVASIPAGAATVVTEAEMIQAVNALGIMVGDENNNMNLGKNVTRAEFITMAVKATPGGDRVGQAASSPYPDVPYSHWASGYVQAGVQAGYIVGYTNGTFRPSNEITLAEGVTIVLKLLGYNGSDFTGVYPSGQMALYHSLGLDENMTLSNASAVLTRRASMILFYNLLTTTTKSGQVYLNTLGHSLNAAGEVDLVSLIMNSMSGPVVATGNWKGSIPFDVNNSKVYRGKTTISLSTINEYDVVYWSESMSSLWVYSDRVTGTIQSISPNESSPTAVTVAGSSYTIETATAAYALSTLGTYSTGERVTLLLGKNGGVAGIAGITAAATTGTDLVGVITALGRETYDSATNSYTEKNLTILATDGKTYTYAWYNSAYKVGDLVRVVTDRNGELTVSRATSSKLTGKVSGDGTTLGRYELASDVQILDTYSGTALRIYPDRLAGVTLDSGDVLYYKLNTAGEISQLVLDDKTGDLHQYGVIAKIDNQSSGISILVTYTIELGSQEATIFSQGIEYTAHVGPCQIMGNLQSPDKITSLTAAPVTSIGGDVLTSGSKSYPISDTVQVYQHQGDGNYLLSNLERVQSQSLTLTAYYDQTASEGGQIRIIVAK